MLPIDETEWQIAEQLRQSSDPKLPRTQDIAGDMRSLYEAEHANYKTKHSFLNFNSHIFAIRKSEFYTQEENAFAGKGTFAQVKRMISQQGERAVVKQMCPHRKARMEPMQDRKRERESRTLQDLGMSHGMFSRTGKKGGQKFYLHMQDFGLGLPQVLFKERNTLTTDRRMEMAIDACLATAELHYFAKNSRTRTRYAHGDIKPDNFTVDASGKLHLVDYGATKTKPQSLLITSRGTRRYAPPQDIIFEKWKYDVLALKRTLLFPKRFRSYDDVQAEPGFYRYYSILKPEIVQAYNLGPFIDTSISQRNSDESFLDDKTSSLSLAAILIMARIDKTFSYQSLVDNSYLCLVIVDLYQNKATSEEIKASIAEALTELTPERATQQALQINRIRNLGLDDESIQTSADLTKLINRLEHLGLIHHIHKIRSHADLSQHLLSLEDTPEFYQYLNYMLEEIPDESEHLGRWIDGYLAQDRLIDLMICYQVTRALHATIFDDQQSEFLIWCHRQNWLDSSFHHAVPRIILNPVALKAMTALPRIYPGLCQDWMFEVADEDYPEKAAIYLKAACLLNDRGASAATYRLVFLALENGRKCLDIQQAVLILLENNLLAESADTHSPCDEHLAKLIIHLSEQGLQSHLPKALAFDEELEAMDFVNACKPSF